MRTAVLTRRSAPAGLAYGLVAVVWATGQAVSSFYLWRLAVLANMPRELAWSLPVALDAQATGATLVWLSARGAARKWGRAVALGALVATLVGNALSHLIEAGLMAVTPWLLIAIAVVYPATLALMAHLVLVMRAEHSAPTAEPVGDASPATQVPVVDASVMDQEPVGDASAPAEPVVDASGEVPSRRRRRTTPEGRRAWIAAQLDKGVEVTGGQVERRFGSRNGAREVAQVLAARNGSPVGVA